MLKSLYEKEVMGLKLEISNEELNERILKNYNRLSQPYYQIDQVFQNVGSDWPGDKEGRALLAFVCHYKISGNKIPALDLMMENLKIKTNKYYYFGPVAGEIIFEQQLSGHSWYLRGLCEYFEQFGDSKIIDILRSVVGDLYYNLIGKFASYPIDRELPEGGISGHSGCIIGNWKLSTDVGCAFMSIDGLSHYYQLTKDEKARQLLDEMIDAFVKIDKVKLMAQTHCTLTAARGMLRLYNITHDKKYLFYAIDIFNCYVTSGMTYTYQNFNWWGRGDTWTEPCAIVDSLMLGLELYKLTGEEAYHTYAVRIYHNGFSTLQRYNGGAGTDKTVSNTTDTLGIHGYEAPFCCTMRLAEGLLYIKENKDLLAANLSGELIRDDFGRYINGDIIYAEISGDTFFETAIDESKIIEMDGHKLIPIIKYYNLPDHISQNLKQRILFN